MIGERKDQFGPFFGHTIAAEPGDFDIGMSFAERANEAGPVEVATGFAGGDKQVHDRFLRVVVRIPTIMTGRMAKRKARMVANIGDRFVKRKRPSGSIPMACDESEC